MKKQIICAATLAITLAAPLAAFVTPASAQDINACRAKTNDADRVACYDALIDGEPLQEPAAPSATPPATPAAPIEHDSPPVLRPRVEQYGPTQEQLEMAFGAEQMPPERRPEVMPSERLDEVTMVVSKYTVNPLGKTTVWFENGQVWRQTTSGALRLHRLGDPPFSVRIERGVLNSFRIYNDRAKTSEVVKRLR